MRRLAAAFVAAVMVSIAAAPPAAAHTITGVRPTDYASRIVTIQPEIRGVTVRLLDLGRRVELRNRTGRDVVVLGYGGEPYLKAGPGGAYENRRSPSTTANRPGATIDAKSAPAAGSTAPPSWRRIGAEPRLRWADRRTRYEGASRSSSRPLVVSTWTIELRHGDTPTSVTGLIRYVPGPSPWIWVAAVLALFGATVLAAVSRRWGRGLSVALAVLIASDAIHTVGTAAAAHDPLSSLLVRVLVGGMVTTLAWVVGVVAIPALQRNHEGGLVAAAGVGLVLAAYSGATDIGVFSNSQVASVFPAAMARVAVACALGLGPGLVVAAIVVIARDPRLRPTVLAPPDKPLTG